MPVVVFPFPSALGCAFLHEISPRLDDMASGVEEEEDGGGRRGLGMLGLAWGG
jgi:hypothetical protein